MDTLSSKGLCLLSLDGGGVRGLASLLILQRIMYNLDSKLGPEVERPLLPCNYFDMIAGTSTGGLIAIMLGVLRMDIDTCVSKYLSMAPKIFPEEGFVSGSKVVKFFKGVRGEARFDAKYLENVVKEMVSDTFGELGEDALLQSNEPEDDPPQCRTFVCVTNKDVSKPFRLRSYRSAWEPGTGCTIWQAARATSAAPLYFPSIRFGKPPTKYVDGGLNYNNPVRSLFDEAKHVWGKSRREIKCIISIGTGVPPLMVTGDTGKQILESLAAIATDTQRTADEFANEMEHLSENAKVDYFRFNVDRGLENMKLEEWKGFDMLTGATSYYLNSHKIDLDRCANALLDSDVSGKHQDSCPTFLSEVPISNHAFFGRAFELSQLRKMLSLQPGETRRQRAVLWGLGGFGKTRIALEYLKIYQKDYSAIFWINAATYESAEQSFAQAATVLGSRLALQPSPASAGARANIRLVQQWLASSKNKDWLMILDSLDDLESFDCRDLVPQCSHGNIIVTSTLSHTTDVLDFQGLEISALDLVDGYEMLLCGIGVEASLDKQVVIKVVRAMGGVPLAIEQARAMIRQGIPVRDFLGHFETQYQKLMAHKPPKSSWDYEKNMSIISIFNMQLTRLDKDGDAENIIAFASCFGPRQVAVNLLGQSQEGSIEISRPRQSNPQDSPLTWLNHIGHDRLAFQLATSHLEGLCLLKLKRDNEGHPVSMALHDAVSRWRFETLKNDTRERWIIAAACAVSKCLPSDVPNQGAQILLLPLIRHFVKTIERYIAPQKLEAPHGDLCHHYGYFMARFAQYYLNSGYTVEGEYVFLQAVDYQIVKEELSWPKDRPSLLLIKGLAIMFSKNGKMENAVEATQILHDASMKLYGPGDEITSWAAARLPVVRERKLRYAKNEQRAVIASRGQKSGLTTSGHTPIEPSQSMSQTTSLNFVPDKGPLSSGYTALTYAASIRDRESIRRELDRGADINGHDAYSLTALQGASWNGHNASVELLLDNGADIDSKNRLGGTALQAASYVGHTAVVNMLLNHGADVNAENQWHWTALQYAAFNDHYSVVQLLVDNGANVNASNASNGADSNAGSYGTALQGASWNGHDEVVQLLLDSGADVNARSGRHGPALPVASAKGHHSVVRILLNHGVDINAESYWHWTALQYAAFNDRSGIVQLLVDYGADVNAASGSSGTALQIAVVKNHHSIVQLLLDNDADVNAKGAENGTALQLALQLGRASVADSLIAAGARENS